MVSGVRSSLVVQSHGLGFPTSCSGLTPYCSTKTSQAKQHRRQNPKTISESNTQQSRTPRETHQSPPIFLRKSLDLCGQCGVRSDSDLALLQLVLFSKVHNYPQSPQSQANCGDLTNVPMTSGANSLPLLWSHSLCSASI